MSSSSLHRFLSVIACFAVALTQVQGVQKGYRAECGDHWHLTWTDHCHDELADHEDHHDAPVGHTHHDHEDEEVPVHEHSVNVEQLTAMSSVSHELPMPMMAIVESMWSSTFAWMPICAALPELKADPPLRRWPQVLAHTIALRV